MKQVQKMKAYQSFEAWKADQTTTNQALIVELRQLIESIAPHLTASVKWGQGCWLNDDRPVCYIHTEPDYLQLGFYSGSSLDDPKSLLKGNGKYIRYIIIKTADDIDIQTFTKLLEQVVN